jgi:hypothetical protein
LSFNYGGHSRTFKSKGKGKPKNGPRRDPKGPGFVYTKNRNCKKEGVYHGHGGFVRGFTVI